MRVLFVSSLWPPSMLGGAESYAARLAGELRLRGHDTGVVTRGVGGEDVVARVPAWPYRLDQYAQQPAWRRALFHARDIYDPMSAVTVRRAMRAFAPHVVHTHSVAGLSAAALTAPSAEGFAHVHHLHDYWLLCQRTSFTRRDGTVCDGRCLSCAIIASGRKVLLGRHGPHVLIAPSDAVARAHRHLQWTRDRLHVLPLPTTRASTVRQWSPGETVTFGYLGQLTIEKGLRTLLRAFERVAPTGCRLVVAGRGALAKEVVGRGVSALGWVDGEEREAFWQSIDCLVVPSQWAEPGATVAVEARGRGLPVVATAAGGLPETVEDCSRPLLVPPGDVEALARSLQRVAVDPRVYRPSGDDSWPTWPRHVDDVERLYELAIQNSMR